MGGDTLWLGSLAESDGSLPPGEWLRHLRASPVYVHRDQFRVQRFGTSMGELYLLLFLNSNQSRRAEVSAV